MDVPNISPQAQNLLLLAMRGEKDLQQWVSGFYLAWDELDIINQPLNYGYTAWTTSEYNQVFLFPQDYIPPNIIIREDEGKDDFSDFGQGTVIRYVPISFPNGRASLFACFYSLFPMIRDIKTEEIGLKFNNPFIDLEEREEYSKEVFFKRAISCIESSEFNAAWQKKLDAGTFDKASGGEKQINKQAGRYFKGGWKDAAKNLHISTRQLLNLRKNNPLLQGIQKDDNGGVRLPTNFCTERIKKYNSPKKSLP